MSLLQMESMAKKSIPIPGDVGPLQYAVPALHPIGQLHPELRPSEKWVLLAIGIVRAIFTIVIL